MNPWWLLAIVPGCLLLGAVAAYIGYLLYDEDNVYPPSPPSPPSSST